MKDLMVEANYVGNRGVWFEANSLIDLNAISIDRLRSLTIAPCGVRMNSSASAGNSE
jgi:hypothetical protein